MSSKIMKRANISLLDFVYALEIAVASLLSYWVMTTGLTRFVLFPALFIPLGHAAALNVLISVIAAELVCNLYTFILIASSHTAEVRVAAMVSQATDT